MGWRNSCSRGKLRHFSPDTRTNSFSQAGSGVGTLRRLVGLQPELLQDPGETRTYSASQVYSFVRLVEYTLLFEPLLTLSRCFLITHAHLDHISSLVLSTGSLGGPRKRIYANTETLEALEGVYNWKLWPNLASYDENDEDYKLLYSP